MTITADKPRTQADTARTTVTRQDRPSGWYLAPALVFFGAFAVLPMVLVVYLSFTSWDGFGSPALSGTENWTRLIEDGRAWDSLWLTLVFMVLTWLVQTPIAMLIGVWAAGRQRNRAILSSLFFLPLLLSTAAIALLWSSVLDPNFGATQSLPVLGGFNFLGDTDLVVYTVVWVISWQYVPFHTLLYQAAARQVPESLYEAATLDGAGRYRQFFTITLPLLKYTIITSTVLMLVGSVTTFDTILILTGGGPGTATRVLPLHMYITGFSGFEFGYASAISVLLLLLGAGLSLAVTRATGFRKMQSQQEGV